jgi:hypothetical protein
MMNAAQIAAFKAAAGGPGGGFDPGAIAVVFALIAGALAIAWAADMLRLLGGEALDGRSTLRRAATYKVRVLVLLLVLIYALS